MAVELISGMSSDVLIVDPISKAARVTLYDSAGVEISPTQRLVTYTAVSSAFTPGATPQDVFAISGHASKGVHVLRMGLNTIETTGGANAWFIRKRSTANTDGTSAPVTAVPHESTDDPAAATVLQYTANPTAGTLVGDVWASFVNAPALATAGGLRGVQIDFTALFGKPMKLLGAGHVLAWNFNGAALPAGLSVLAYVSWVEVD